MLATARIWVVLIAGRCVERKGAHLVVLASEGPAGGDLKGDAGVSVVEAARWWGLGIGWGER